MTNEVLQKIASDEQNISSSNGLEAKLPYIKFSTSQWQQKNFSDLFTILSNNTHSRAELTNYGTIRNIHYGDVLIKFGNILDTSQAEIPYLCENCKYKDEYMQDGDIIIADTAEDYTAGKCTELFNVGTSKIISGLHTIPCRPKIKFAQKYLGYYTNSPAYRHQLLSLLQGIKVYSISKTNLSNTHVSYPPLPEQQKIADFLSLVDQRIEKQRQLIESLKKYKRGYFQRIISSLETSSFELKNIVDEYNAKSKIQNELPILSSTLSGIKLQNDYFNKQAASETTIGYKIVPFGYFTYRSMSDTGEFRFNLQNIIEKGIVSPAYPVFKVKEEYNAEFVEYILNETDKIKSQLLVKKEGGTRYALSFSKFQTLKIDLPTKSVQDKMVSQLRYANKILTNEEGVLSNLQKLKNGLLQQMFI